MEMKPLNIFQRCIRVWEESHPYNAAQVLEVAGEADVARISAAWNEVLAASGLGTARVDGRWFCYEEAPCQKVEVVGASPGGMGLEGHLTRELNRPFSDEGAVPGRHGTLATMPFRPFVVPGNGAYHMGLIYQHWVADSMSLRMLVREWFCRLHDPGGVVGRPVHVPHRGLWRYFGPSRSGWNLVAGAISVLRSTTEFSRARRIDEGSGGQDVECTLHRLPDGMVDLLLAVARRRQATLNDLFLAALARACDEHGADPRQSRRDLALGAIVDLRAMSSENLENTFGLFLGFTSVVIRAELLRNRDWLVANVASQSAHQKESRAAQVSMMRMAAGYAQGRFLSPRRLAAFYRNYMPLSGGISNVNMNRAWPAKYHPSPLLDYIRAAPTGPMVPLVIAVTTIGKRLTFVLTRRASLVDRVRGAELARTFVDELTAQAKMG